MPTILWLATGLASDMTGIERLVVATVEAFSERATARQIVVVDADANWAHHLSNVAELLRIPRPRGGVARAPLVKVDGLPTKKFAIHSFGPPIPRSIKEPLSSSYTIYDWGPYHDRDIDIPARLAWVTATLRGVRKADLVHILAGSTAKDAPWCIKRLLNNRRTVSGLPYVAKVTVPRNRTPITIRQKNTILSVGTNVPRKRFDLLCAAIRRVEDVTLLLAGNGTEELTFHPPGRTASRITGLGRVTDDELASLYQSAALFVLPSLYEGFGLPVLEAWQVGCPILITDAVARRLPDEIVKDAEVVATDIDSVGLAMAITSALGNTRQRVPQSFESGGSLVDILAERLSCD